MDAWQNPNDPEQQPPPFDQDEPADAPPDEPDPEAMKAPGAGQEDPDSQAPPMQASAAAGAGDAILGDAAGIEREPVGNDNIREGRVGGVMGSPHASMGQGQGG